MLKPQTLINQRYRIVRDLGAGGMGSVFVAYDERLRREVALKLLRADLAADPKARERFTREAQIAAQLTHPNIVKTFDVGDSPEGPYLVQELLDGRTLDTVLPLSPPQAVTITMGIAAGLEYIHRQGYVHCDIKPQNIMLLGDLQRPRVVLLDFGIARAAGTDTTLLIATPHYLAPERAAGDAPTPTSDLYALGIVLYQSIVGKPPFDGAIHALLDQHRRTPVGSVATHVPAAAALDPIIARLTAKQPADRYDSAAALQASLGNVQFGAIHALPTQVVARPQPPRAAAGPPLAAAAVASAPRRAPAAPPLAAVSSASATAPRSRRWLLIVPVLLGLLVLGGLMRPFVRGSASSGANAMPSAPSQPSVPAAPSAPQQIRVPNVIGLPIDEATRQIEQAGLMVIVGDALQSDQPPDTVAATNPTADQALPPSGQVVLQPSLGPPQPIDDQEDDDKGKKEKDNKGKGRGKNK